MLNSQLLLNYAENFFGYGNPNAPVWFVGLEEAGGRTEQVVADRLKLWSTQFDSRSIVDAYEFHQTLKDYEGKPLIRLFEDPVPAQPTWDRLIRIQLAWEGHTAIRRSDIQAFRKTEWVRSTSKSCLVELFPLPSPSVADWNYEDWTSIKEFKTREGYQKALGDKRALAIKELIREFRPKVVIFYGSRWKRWSQIAGFRWKKISDSPVPHARVHQADGTLYAVVHHPAARGATDADFDQVGEYLRTLVEAE